MVLPNETLAAGAPSVCSDCKKKLELDVHFSPAGFYIGTYCFCGPYSRESNYFDDRGQAQTALDTGAYSR